MAPAALTGFLLCIVSVCGAQDRETFLKKMSLPAPYEIGLSIGRNQYFGDLYKRGPFISSGSNWGNYAFARRRITPTIALRGNALIGRLTARDRDDPSGQRNYRSMKFTTPLLEFAALIEVYPLRKLNTRRLTPYFFAGIGSLFTNPVVTTEEGATLPPSDSILAIDRQQTKKVAPVFPIGLGVTYAATPTLKVGLEVGHRFSTSDYIDGFHEASYGYSKRKDNYLLASLLVVYQLTNRAPLRPDPNDVCPDEFGDPATCGCPDDDQDGVPNACDCCPDEKGDRAFHGCPKAHTIEYVHARMPARMRYCPLCPPDLLNAQRTLKTNAPDLPHKTRQPAR